MADQTHLDGNALGGLLYQLFERDMTDQRGRCRECGTVKVLGEIHVFRDAPGDVMRCPACNAVLMVIVQMRTGYRVSFESLSWLEVQGVEGSAVT
ncbi:MAG TPA: DUF6510 family protein [Acidimicrobiia bacterium]|nr:DUF6510 family protein [Acidimicrobiia bacterium]